MSREAYERVRKALQGTTLDGQIEKLNSELHLTPESPEWTIAALGIIAGEAVTQRVERTSLELAKASSDLPLGLKAAGAEIVRGLAEQIGSETCTQIVEGALPAIIDTVKTEVTALTEQVAATDVGVTELAKNAMLSITNTETRVQATLERVEEASTTITSAFDRHHKIDWTFKAVFLILGLLVGFIAKQSYFAGSEINYGCRTSIEATGTYAKWTLKDTNNALRTICSQSSEGGHGESK
ncbi:MAG: hypothetical protein ACYC8W_07750 [Candidatus Tyrphobacter sp.]